MKRTKRGTYLIGVVVAILTMVISVGQSGAQSSDPPGDVDVTSDTIPTTETRDTAKPTWSEILPADDGNIDTACDSSRFDCVMEGAAVLDKETGLVWDRAPAGKRISWGSALQRCYNRSVAGRKGWRLPNIEELTSLLDTTQNDPALPTPHPFTLTEPEPGFYWTKTSVTINRDWAWSIFLGLGEVIPTDKEINGYSWCVRGES